MLYPNDPNEWTAHAVARIQSVILGLPLKQYLRDFKYKMRLKVIFKLLMMLQFQIKTRYPATDNSLQIAFQSTFSL